MKKIIFLFLVFIPVSVHAEFLISVKVDGTPPNRLSGQEVKLRCFECGPYETSIRQALLDAGYVFEKTEPGKRMGVGVRGRVNVLDGDHVRTVSAEDVIATDYPPTPPYITQENHQVDETPSGTRSVLNLDAGQVAKGMRLSGSSGGGVAIGIIGSLAAGAIDSYLADGQRVAGVAIVNVNFPDYGSYVIMAVSNTEEKPRDLMRAAFEAAADCIRNGVKP
jgi:hypothetical protein